MVVIGQRGETIPDRKPDWIDRLLFDLKRCTLCGEGFAAVLCSVCGRDVCMNCAEIIPHGLDGCYCHPCLQEWLEKGKMGG